jgi:enoyl-CoA hydratase
MPPKIMDADPAIRCMVITGNERVFAAGADIQEMVDASAVELLYRNTLGFWDELYDISTKEQKKA